MATAGKLSRTGSNTRPVSPPRPLSGDRDDLSDISDSSPSPSALPEHPHPPSLRSSSDYPAPMTASSTPLGHLNAARRPGGPLSSRSSGLNEDTMAKMKAFSLSRQGPPSIQPGRMPPQPASTGDVPTTTSSPVPNSKLPSIPGSNERQSPRNVGIPGGVAAGGLAQGMPAKPPAAPSPKMGGLAAKRGMKKGMKLSDVAGPPSDAESGTGQGNNKDGSSAQSGGKGDTEKDEKPQSRPTDSLFSKYSEYIDTQAGTLNFKNKAIIHGGGIEFTSGGSFSISLDEVDTLDELGKGNYGTVYKVRHSRPHLRKPGQGLRGIMARRGSIPGNGTPDGVSPARAASPGPAQNDLSGAIMAMKEIRLELDESKFTAIIMELDILHRCISPFIIDFYGAFFQEGAVYICVEFMDGGSVDKLYGNGIPENILRKVILSTVMGLKCLKDDHNIIHRDVKPTNILINTRGQIKICDFGVSGNLVASIAKTNIGCQSYMAPERIAGGGVSQAGATSGGTYSVQSDIWSLGLTMIECAVGRYPYPPDTFNNIFSQLNAIVHGDPPTLPDKGFSEDAHNFVRSCLNKDAKSRPTYAMLLRHPWLSSLMKRPQPQDAEDADSDDEEEEDSILDTEKFGSSQNNNNNSGSGSATPRQIETADKDVAEWVIKALERKKNGGTGSQERPALHAVALDAVPGSPLLDDPATISPTRK
ncbi:hypothetical protein FQN54_001244 [Arachnomyces sp. PD_36]|nr:hypothetical protein FQN54_001244 [Arachnomyces sp. PD_36]